MKKILTGLAIAVCVGFTIFFGVRFYNQYQASNYQETAVPYIKMVIPELSKWDPAIIKGYMHAESLKKIPDEKITQILNYLSRLGSLANMQEPKFSSVNSFDEIAGGGKKLVTYTVETEYEHGDAVIDISLIEDGDSFLVYNFNVNSKALAE